MDLFTALLQRLDAPSARYASWLAYSEGRQPISFLSPEAQKALGNRLPRLSINIPRLVVESLAERLRVVGFSGADAAWPLWLANDMDLQAPVLHRNALLYGDAYVICWADGSGEPTASVESATQVTSIHDPGTRQMIAAVKRWTDENAGVTNAVLYKPDEIVRYRADSIGATISGFKVQQVIPNPLGVVPVVRFRNGHRLSGEWGWSEISDCLSLTDALTKLTVDLLTASEFGARPRRWAVGLELEEKPVLDDDGNPVVDDTGEPVVEATNPIQETDRMMVSENEATKFGQLPGASLDGYQSAINIIMRQIAAVTSLPDHLLGISGENPTSADAIRASEAGLTAKAEARQAAFGRSWEMVAKLLVAIQDGVDPATVQPRVVWADPSTRSAAQEADAVTKLVQAGVLPWSYGLKRLGYTDDQITEIRQARQLDAPAQPIQ